MFGRVIDYYLLKPLTHTRNLFTEDELDNAAVGNLDFTIDRCRNYLRKVRTEYFSGRFVVDKTLSYLDIGCGNGILDIGLVDAGIDDVTGIDISERQIAEANNLAEKLIPDNPKPLFHTGDVHRWQHERQYDVILALATMEHINDPLAFFHKIRDLMKPTGVMLAGFVPFHSPFGDHMEGFFRINIPWRGVMFSEDALLRLRAECFRPTDQAERYQDMVGGLNLMRFSEYTKWLHDAGLEVVCHNINPQLKFHDRYKPLYPLSRVLTGIPKIQDYFSVTVYSVIRRRF